MRGRYLITRTVEIPSPVRWVNDLERHETLPQAERALAILNEHEERNGRGPGVWKIVDTDPAQSVAQSS